MSEVSLIKSKDHYGGTLLAMEAIRASIEDRVGSADEVVIKINFVSVLRELATTPSKSVEGVIVFLRSFYQGPIKIVEMATMGTTKLGFARYGFNRIARKYEGVEILDLAKDELVEMDLGGFKVPYSKTMREASCLISVTRPKTHNSVVATLSLKNVAVGGIVGRRGAVHSGDINKNLFMSALFRSPDIAVLDGVVSMEGDGPIGGSPLETEWISAGTDFLSVDTLALYLMGIDLSDVGYLSLCSQEGIGETFPENVKVIGEDPSTLRKNFKMHATFEDQRKWL